MALTTDQIADAHATLVEIGNLVAKIKKEEDIEKKKELYDRLAQLNN